MSKRKVEAGRVDFDFDFADVLSWSVVRRLSARRTACSYRGMSASAAFSSGTRARFSHVKVTIRWISRIVAASVRWDEGGAVARK